MDNLKLLDIIDEGPFLNLNKTFVLIKRGFSMLISKENYEIRNKIWDFEKRIDNMHLDFFKFYQGVEPKMPDWETLEKELIFFSRKRITDLGLSKNFDRILFKFQNRKKIWLSWVQEYHHSSKKRQAVEEPTDKSPTKG